jgi:3-hydroxybutyryl-CoA dehydrogenase
LASSHEIDDKISSIGANNKYCIGVIGTGQMGIQFAEYLSQMGYQVILKTRFQDKVPEIHSRLQRRLLKRSPEQEVERCFRRITITTQNDDLSDAAIIIEASKEDLAVKSEIFQTLSDVCSPNTIFATNSSSLSTDLLAEATDRPDRFIGMHFFNPIHKMSLVEIILGRKTSDATREFTVDLARDLKKNPIIVKNSPGFIVNRLLMPQINEAVHLLSEGVASKEDIDSAIKLGLNHPMGPLELADFIGLDTCLAIIKEINIGAREHKLEPAPLLQEMVAQGKMGYKSGEGFYTYR